MVQSSASFLSFTLCSQHWPAPWTRQARHPQTQSSRNTATDGQTCWTFSEHQAEFMAKGCVDDCLLSYWLDLITVLQNVRLEKRSCLKGCVINWWMAVFTLLKSLGLIFNFALVVTNWKMPTIILSPNYSLSDSFHPLLLSLQLLRTGYLIRTSGWEENSKVSF